MRMNDLAVSDPPCRAGVPLGLRARSPEAWATEQGWVKENSGGGGKRSHLRGGRCYKGSLAIATRSWLYLSCEKLSSQPVNWNQSSSLEFQSGNV